MAFTNPFAAKDSNDPKRGLPLPEADRTEKDTVPTSAPRNGSVPSRTTVPARPAVPSPKPSTSSDVFDSLLSDDPDEENILAQRAEAARNGDSTGMSIPTQSLSNSYYFEDEDPLLRKISEKRKQLQKKFPSGGIQSSRFITTDILREAPKDYFDKYSDIVEKGVSQVRLHLTEEGRSEIINDAQMNPTDDGLQDAAYFTIYSLASEFMNRSPWRDTHKSVIITFICNEIIGLGPLEPLWRDPTVSEIICNGPFDVQVEIRGELYRVPSCKFRNRPHMMALLERLFGSVGKTLSQTTPQQKGRLHDRSRIYATHPIISPDGPNLNIRRHPKGFWTPESLVKRNAASPELMSFIGNTMYKGGSVLVAGGMSSGKTTLLNALTGFYKDNVRIITLEDNLEMKPNPRKMLAAAEECREPAPDRPGDRGTTMRDLVKGATQQRPNIIIVGEVTDSAAYDLCQALNTGHSGTSTVHANGPDEAMIRLSSLIAQGGMVTPSGALDMISAAFDIIVMTKHFPVDGSRRIFNVSEVSTTPIQKNGRLVLPTRTLWTFVEEGLDENRRVLGHWEQVADISQERKEKKLLDLERDLTWDELKNISALPEGEELA